MSKNQKSTKAQRNICISLYSLLLEKPYKDISVSEICKKVGLSRQAFYLNFKDKDDVLRYQFRRLFSMLLETVDNKKIQTIEELVEVYTTIVDNYSIELKLLADNNLGGLVGEVMVDLFVGRPPILPTQKLSNSELEHLYANSFWIYAFISVYSTWLRRNKDISSNAINGTLINIMRGHYFLEKKQ